jgi:hypothetical protein
MKKETLLGLIAVGSTIAYIWLKKQNANSTELEGVEITVNPKKLVEGALAMSNINPIAKHSIRQFTDRAISRYYEN